MNDTLSLAHPKVRSFIKATKAKIMGLEEFDKERGGLTKSFKNRVQNFSGFYNPKHDTIVINPGYVRGGLIDRTLLHELGHWSGHSTRMRRKVVITGETGTGPGYKSSDFDTEEMIAEMIAHKLGTDMGIMTKEWNDESVRFLSTWQGANELEANTQVKQAVWFLINIAMPFLEVG